MNKAKLERPGENRARTMTTVSKSGGKWNTKNELLLHSVIKGQLSTVKRLIERSFTDLNTKNAHGMSCLQLAIIHGHIKLAEYLIHRGIDLYSVDSDGWTALHDAALKNSKSLSRKLISKGCSTTQATKMGELPIDVACSVALERFLCEQMATRGEETLAQQYFVYLGLEHLGDDRIYAMDELEGGQHIYVRRKPKPSLANKEPSISNSTSNQGQSPPLSHSAESRGLTSTIVGRRDASLRNETDVDAVGQSSLARLAEEAIIDRPLPPPPAYESVNRRPLEASVINSSRQSHGPQFVPREFSYCASLAISKEDLVATTAVRKDRRSALRQATTSAASPESRRRKVSFVDFVHEFSISMARTKANHSLGGTVFAEKDTPPSSSSTSRQSSEESSFLSAEQVAHLNDLYEGRCDKDGKPINSSDSEESCFDAEEAISKLKMRPRKSSIASPSRRQSSDHGKRRSVSFQPEVVLQDIVTDGDAKEVRQVLQSGIIPDVNKMGPSGLTALHQSAIDGNLECAETLIRNGANVNSMDCEQWTPLHAAAMTGHADIVQFLLQSKADPTMKNEEGDTAYDVAKTGPIRRMLLCAMNGKNPDGDDFSDGEYSGEEEEEYSHAESDSESDSGDEGDSNSSLFGSTKQSLKERLGLNHSSALKNSTARDSSISPSPDLDQLDNVFTTGTSPVVRSNLVADVPRRDRELTDSTSSYGSLYEPELEGIRELDERHHPVHNGTRTTAESDIDKVSEDQGISTMEGGSSDCSHRSRTLSDDEGTSRDVLDSDLVPGSLDYKFQEGVLYCNVDSVLKLAKQKAEIDVNRVNKTSGITALHHAVLEENFALVQHLVKDFEASLNAKDIDGWTPLHAASAVGNICIAQYLLDCGAKPSVLNNQCEFPVDIAEDEAMEKLLKNAMLGPGVGKIFKGIFA